MKGTCTARDLHSAIDEAWMGEREATCPECDGTNVSESGICWDCQANDYRLEMKTER
jgi:acetone carboxylase gamma subunit